ncbi:peptide chain release factor N(5)-glutamine methyltransferase [Legionella israelensis]|uniref:peptide chain release factor N(5)-glutamine methyltransferase n=1 Tax=Legionella israelensis TaxID=454 RepID=UPI00117D7F45|nr:peptide chain release factor N(5)-glutamine methyltransferase [Legionella israelensis]QDP73197.1 peptide chain release factor N(5)-glutamine methyltransferase [Legionella israelensis]
MIDINTILLKATERLQAKSSSPRLDAEVLLAHLLKASRSYLYAHKEQILTERQLEQYQALIDKRFEGIPVAYLTGNREFWSFILKVNRYTLIPRPSTEKLVEITLQLLQHQPQAKILDLGTGSGAIAIALAKERPDWQITACDKSEQALEVAQENAQSLAANNIRFYLSNWFTHLPPDHYHAIVSNPPYIAENDPHLKQGDVQFEPAEALVSGKDGLNALKTISQQAYPFLLPKGFLLLEHGYDQKSAITSILKQSGYKKIQCWQDDEGIDRICEGQREN